MVEILSFKNLPFVPEKGDVIYVEQTYHKRLNNFIRNNYEWLRNTFAIHHLHFYYLPLQVEELVSYHAPYLTAEDRQTKAELVPSLSDYIVGDAEISPSLVFARDIPDVSAPCDIVLLSVAIDTEWALSTKSIFASLAEEIEQAVMHYKPVDENAERLQEEIALTRTRHSLDRIEESIRKCEIGRPKPYTDAEIAKRLHEERASRHSRFSLAKNVEPDEADIRFDWESVQLIKEIRERVEALRNRGVNTMILHDVIDESEHLSRLRITKDYRIFLVDYQNMEIQLPVLPKAVFLLFLQHPEGIRFKELTDYYSELLQIYRKMNPIGGRMKQEQSIRDVTNPCSNSINEKCARIREAFVRNFDDRLAKNYYITGKRGEAKRIVLDKSMIIWE